VNVVYFSKSRKILLTEHIEKENKIVVTVFAETHKIVMQETITTKSNEAHFLNKVFFINRIIWFQLNEEDLAIVYKQKISEN
jgi:hypothetical protein